MALIRSIANEDTNKALAIRPYDTPEEQGKRIEDAKKLEEKLEYIQKNVPGRVQNVSGSTAGAGSGDFHQYRTARRREQMRLARMEYEDKKTKEQEEFMKVREQKMDEAEERTAKRRAKRQKKKNNKKMRKEGGAAGAGPGGGDGESDGDAPEQADLD